MEIRREPDCGGRAVTPEGNKVSSGGNPQKFG